MGEKHTVRQMREEDIAGAVALQRACFPAPFPEELLWRAEHLQRHLEIFPEGQFVAEADGRIVGSASSAIISESQFGAHLPWEETLGGAFLTAHDPHGTTLYGVDVSVHPAWRGQGIGRALYEARFELARRLGLTRYATACRIPDFRKWRPEPQNLQDDLKEYVALVERRELSDRTLSPLLRYGLKVTGVICDYMEDEESANAAALLEWQDASRSDSLESPPDQERA